MDTARLIVTTQCNRGCEYCCNTPEMLSTATPIRDLADLKDYQYVCVTGGEPLLDPKTTLAICKTLQAQGNKVYLYSASWSATFFEAYEILKCIDGLQYTLHPSITLKDTLDFSFLQTQLELPEFKELSTRLSIIKGVTGQLSIRMHVWDDIKVIQWIDDCPLPSHETLFIL